MPKQPQILWVGEWLPDQPDYQNQGSANVRNVFPRTQTSYGPVATPSPYSDALGDRCQGAAAYISNSGNTNIFAGDATKLYNLVSGGSTWTDVSKGGGYNTPATGQWHFDVFNNIALATNYADPIQAFTLGSSTAYADLSADAPKAKYIETVKGFLVTAYTNDGTFGVQPQRVWWSGLADPTNWPTPGSIAAAQAQSSYNDLFGAAGSITGLIGNLGTADAAVFMEHAVWRMLYVGPPLTFDFLPAEGVKGCPAPNSIVQYGNLVYYLGEDGFYVFDGTSSQPIGAQKFDSTFYADLDQSYMERVWAAVDPANKTIMWAYPGAGNTNGNPNHILIYNWSLQRAAILDITLEVVMRLVSIGYTLDELYTVLGYTIDGLPAGLDSALWQGGLTLLGLFDTDHKLNFFTGENLAATVDTTETQFIPGKRAIITNARPLVDGGIPSVAVGHRDRLVDPVTWTSAIPMNSLGTSPVRTSGRYTRAEITLPAGSDFLNIQGTEIEASSAGIR